MSEEKPFWEELEELRAEVARLQSKVNAQQVELARKEQIIGSIRQLVGSGLSPQPLSAFEAQKRAMNAIQRGGGPGLLGLGVLPL